jgi:hypothetical protein
VIFKDKFADRRSQHDALNPVRDSELNEALTDFRLSVHAWSENAFSRSRMVAAAAPPRRVWRLAAGWALGCVLVAGGAFGGFYGHLHRQQAAGWEHHPQETGIHETSAVKLEQPAVVQRVQQTHNEEEDLLAKVDSDVSRQVPAAMEPLAQLMAGDETR